MLSTTGEAFSLCQISKTKSLSKGDAAMAWKKLHAKYEAKDSSTKHEVKRMFNNDVLDNKEDPDLSLIHI